MSFTTENNGTPPIARVVSRRGYYFVYLSTTPAHPSPPPSMAGKKLSPAAINQISLALQHGLTLDELYSSMSTLSPLPTSQLTFQADPNETIEIMPSPYSERISINGPAGAGKTYVAAALARNYHRIHPDRAIILFARQSDDPAFKGIQLEEIVLDSGEQEAKGRSLEDLAEEIKRVPLTDYSNKLVIIDDADNVQNKVLHKTMVMLNNDLMCNGRKQNITVIFISHLVLRGHDSKVILNEANKIFFFPSTGTRGIHRYLKEYAGFENKQIDKIIQAGHNSRWIMLSCKPPRYIATEKTIFFI